MKAPPVSSHRLPVWRPTAGALVFVFALATIVATVLVNQRIEIIQQERLTLEAARLDGLLEQRLTAYEQVLRGGLGLFAASDDVTLDEWIHYVDVLHLDERYPGFKSLNYAPAVPRSEIDAFVVSVRNGPGSPPHHYDPAVLRDYRVWSSGTDVSPTDFAPPIQFVAPFTPENQQLLGLDPMQDRDRRAALLRSAETHTTTLTTGLRFQVATSQPERVGFVAYLPIELDGEFQGWLSAAFLADDFMHGLNADVPAGIDFEVSDSVGNLLYSGRTAADGAPIPLGAHSDLDLHTTVEMSGQTWDVHYETNDAFPARAERIIPWIVALSGVVVTLLVLAVAWTGAGWRHRAVQLQRTEAEVRHQATHDPLTGLPNRTLFLERLEAAIGGAPFALAYIDVDGFKPINDSHGHRAGDALLTEIAKRLQSGVGPADSVARLGGDEFAMMIADPTFANDVTATVLESLREPFTLPGGMIVNLSVSIGIASYDPASATDSDDLVHAADAAMLDAKRAGRDRISFAPANT